MNGSFMKKLINLLLILSLSAISSCTPPKVQENRVTLVERKALSAANEAKQGVCKGPVFLSYRKLDIPEISQHLDMDVDTAREYLKDSKIHGYFSLQAKNYPPGAEFVLYQVDMSRNVHVVKTYYVNGNGNLVTPLDDLFIEIQNNYLFFSNYLPGEPVDFVLGSKDGQYYAATRIVPNPIEASDDQGRGISLQVDHPNRRHYMAYCTGLEPGKPYMLITVFENEKLMHAVEADLKGEAFQATGPTVPWITGGDGSIELRGEGINPPLSVNFKWGL